MVHGVLYATAGTRRAVVALDAATGEMLWMHSENEGARADAAPRKLSGHGLAYWTDGKEERIIYVTIGYQMVALEAKTGARVASFGNKGIVDLKMDDDQEIDLINGEVGLHSTPVVAKDVVIVGAAHLAGQRQRRSTMLRATFADMTSRPANVFGFFTQFPRLASLELRLGKMIPGLIRATPVFGDRFPSTNNLDWSTCR